MEIGVLSNEEFNQKKSSNPYTVDHWSKYAIK